MTLVEILIAALQWLAGFTVSAVFLLVLFIGFCVVVGLRKLRPTSPTSLVVRSLDVVVGTPETYLAPDAPHGPADQLRTPELLELAARRPN